MRSLIAAAAVLLACLTAAGCDAGKLDATDLGSSAPPIATPAAPTSASVSAPSPTHAHTHPSATSPAPSPSSTPRPTAVATNTANAGSGSVAGVPTTYAAATARLAALHSAPHRALDRFTTTGDVVYCVLRDSSIPTSCELRRGAIRDPGVCGQSMADAVGRIQLGADGAVPECNTDTIREPGATVVAAPAVITSGTLECGIERIGVTCVDTHTHAGFFLTPGKYATFS